MINTSFPPWYPGMLAALVSPGYLFYYLILLSGSIYGYTKFNRLSRAFKFLVILVSLITISETISRILAYTITLTVPVYHFLIPLQIIGYTLIFKELFLSKNIQKAIIGIGFFVLITSISKSIVSGLGSFPSLNITVLSLQLILSSLYLFYQIVQNPTERNIFNISQFWLAVGTLIFYAGTFTIFTLSEYIILKGYQMPEWKEPLLTILNYILYGSYFVSFYLESRNPQAEHEIHK